MAIKGLEKRLNAIPPVPDRDNFMPLLKEALTNDTAFEYRSIPEGRSIFLYQEAAGVIIDVLGWLSDDYRQNFLNLVPLHITELSMKCWDIKSRPWQYRHMLRYREPERPEHQQYELTLVLKDENLQA